MTELLDIPSTVCSQTGVASHGGDVEPVSTQTEERCPGLPCITQDPTEPSGPEYLAVCTGYGELLSRSTFCPPECGGHPICRPCHDLAQSNGLTASV